MTNEKTQSEIFEEQLKSLYQPLKPKETNEAVANNQNLANESLVNQNLENLAKESVKDLEAEPSYLSTGIAYLDKKIKDRSITAFDYYMAKKFLGMDLNVNLNGNLNLKTENKTRLASINKATQDIFDDIKALDLGNDLIQKAQEYSGLINQIKLWINHKTRGLKGVDYDLARTDNARISYANRVAKIYAQGGQITQKTRDQAQEMTAFGARSKEENTARLGENQGRLIQILEQDINNLESLGGKVPESVMLELLKHKKRLEHIQKNQGKIKLKEYQEITPYSEHEQDDGK
ncbi:Coiled-coil domain-containing protein [Helicobacter pylori]|uniref:Coiled-coil domain-containing protein n=1 Tax=Helicobacter pylori TaxID=210 RepID=UPI00123BC750|nr:Coiled-coil domain-containing protein [Helicobacter pylori]KAA6500313.1 Coiled-coil domain-containing protein [Helicobacter pylori]KAA6511088.1 Coiled-coil domain-containing protein [Helicobacter pylori]